MMIAIGRRRLILSLIVVPPVARSFDVPAAQNATDAELARLNVVIHAAEDRTRWEAEAIRCGLPWTR